jgi:hypothetical protein
MKRAAAAAAPLRQRVRPRRSGLHRGIRVDACADDANELRAARPERTPSSYATLPSVGFRTEHPMAVTARNQNGVTQQQQPSP